MVYIEKIEDPVVENEMNTIHDDGRDWGYMENGAWLKLPKVPMLLAHMGPPPFDVTLPHTEEIRRIIHNPEETIDNGKVS